MRNLNKNIKSEKGIMTFLPVRMTVKGSDSKWMMRWKKGLKNN